MPTPLAERPVPVAVPAFSSPGRCTLCCGTHLREVLNLGQQPLANGLLSSPDEPCARFPLRLGFCEGCGHVELLDTVPPDALFGQYVYRTGASAPMARHFAGLAKAIAARTPDGWVCEIGSNDGTLLNLLRDRGLDAHGVDPCSVARGVQYTVHRYFGKETAADLRAAHGPAGCVVACNVLAHCPDPAAILGAAHDLLTDGGLLVLEVPYLRDMVDNLAWDTVYHEHGSYFSALVLDRLFTRTGYVVANVLRLPDIHGGSLRIYARAVRNVQRHATCGAWNALIGQEIRNPVDWTAFAKGVQDHADLLASLCADVEYLIGYGCPAKCTVLLNYAGIKPRAVYDTTPEKHGKFVPGVGVPIRPMEELRGQRPEAVLLLAWNYADDIIAREPWFRDSWLVPFPDVRRA